MADYFEKLKKYMNSDPSQDNYLDKAAKGALGFIEDRAPVPGDDSLREPLLSPIDLVPYGQLGSLAAKGVGAGAKALAAPAERILANEIGSVGYDVAAPKLIKAAASKDAPGVASRLATMPVSRAASPEIVAAQEAVAHRAGAGDLATASLPKALFEQQRLNRLQDMLAKGKKRK